MIHVFKYELIGVIESLQIFKMPTIQKTFFGDIAIEGTYYQHEPATTFEQFVVAFYFFNKGGKPDKNSIYKEATKKWNKRHNDDQAFVRSLILKHSKDR